MKATCCLLKYNSEPVNLTLLCLNCEIPKNHVNSCIWHGLSHLIRRLMDDPWSGASFVEYLYSFVFFHALFPCFLSCCGFSFVLEFYPNAWVVRKKNLVWLWTLTRECILKIKMLSKNRSGFCVSSTRNPWEMVWEDFSWSCAKKMVRRAFRYFNNFGPHQCYFWRRPIWWEWTMIWWVGFYYEVQESFSWLNDTFQNLLMPHLSIEEMSNESSY